MKHASSTTKAKCCCCKTEFQLGLMGASALASHARSKKHQDICKLREGAGAALDLDKSDNLLPANQINIGTALKERLASLSLSLSL